MQDDQQIRTDTICQKGVSKIMKYAVGIDVGGTNTRVALINEEYKILERIQFSTDSKDPEVYLM